MVNPGQLRRLRWAVRGVLGLGVAASVVANVLHAVDNPISQSIAAWPPLALLLTVELIARVPVHSRTLAAARLAATATIAGIAAWVSYWHMAGVAARYGETGASPYMLPVSVDGLIVVASVCLVELGGRLRDVEAPRPSTAPFDGRPDTIISGHRAHEAPAAATVPTGPSPAAAAGGVRHGPAGARGVDGRPGGADPDTAADSVSTRQATPRKRQPSSRERIERAHRRTPKASDADLARRLELSTRTVRRHRPRPENDVRAPAGELVEVAR